VRNFRILGVSIFGNLQRYELEKIRSPWLRGSMRFRSLDCDGADEAARWFCIPDGNARRLHATFDCPNADAPGSDARSDGTNANAPRSNDEFSLGPSTL
jgi:hypothetical protein